MSNEKLADWLSDSEWDLIEQYVETDKGWKDVEKFLFSKNGEFVKDMLFKAFLNNSKDRMKFDDWAIDLYNNRGPEEDEDR